MANEFIARNGVISKGNVVVTGSLSTSGSLTTTGTITAQTLVVQTITSSISSITGSTNFGSLSSNTHTFTGSLLISGSNVLIGTPTSNGFRFKVSNNGAEEWALNPGDSTNVNNHVNYNRNTSAYIGANYLAATHSFLNGSVGIGTNSPWGKFNVVAGTNLSLVVQDSGTADTIELVNYSNSGGVRAIALNGSVLSFGTGTAGGGGTTERMRIAAGGLVTVTGVGNSSTTEGIFFKRTSNLSQGGYINGNGGVLNIVATNEQSSANGFIVFSRFNGTTVSESMRITDAGRVAIGRTSPGTALSVAGQSEQWQLALSTDTGSGAVIGSPSANVLAFGDWAGNEKMRILPDGQVLMNTTSVLTSGWLCISVASNNYNAIVLRDTGTSYSSGNYYQLFTNSTNTIAGSISHNTITGVNFNTSSDYRLKEDFKNFNGLDILSNIKFYDFKWKDEDKRMHGVVAHELEPLIPLAVSGTKDKVDKDGNIIAQGVDYSKIVPVIGKALQEAMAKIETLEARVQELENK